jgi:hypothetical protein
MFSSRMVDPNDPSVPNAAQVNNIMILVLATLTAVFLFCQ